MKRQTVIAIGLVVLLSHAVHADGFVFADPVLYPLGPNGTAPHRMASGDLDNDGNPDLAIGNSGGGRITVLWNDGAGRFTDPPAELNAAIPEVRPVAIGDIDNDGDNDIVTVGNVATVVAFRNNGSRSFTRRASSIVTGPNTPHSIAIGKLDGNALPDIVIGSQSGVLVCFGIGGQRFGPAVSEFTGRADYVSLADVDGANGLDIAIGSPFFLSTAEPQLLKNNGQGGFAAAVDLFPWPDNDVNNRGTGHVAFLFTGMTVDKAAVGSFGGGNTIRISNVASPFNPDDVTVAATVNLEGLVAADLDDDGDMDLASNSFAGGTARVFIAENEGGNAFADTACEVTLGAGASFPHWVVADDFNGDGQADLAIPNRTSDNVSVLLNCAGNPAGECEAFRRGDANADGTVNVADPNFILNFLFQNGPPPPCREAADANGSGSVDIADPTFLLGWLFQNTGVPPPAPGPSQCGFFNGGLGCATYNSC